MEIKELLEKMSVEEKLRFLRGANWWNTYSNTKYELKKIWMTDGPNGLRKELDKKDELMNESIKSVCLPTASLMACSFDKELIKEYAKDLALEAKKENVNVVLGPGVNVKTNPLCGRNFEYFSEDPLLAGELGKAYISGLEEEGVGTSLKHFPINSNEQDRARINEIVDERTLNEIHLKAFKIALKANPSTVMPAYSKVNGEYACENKRFLKDFLRNECGFKGVAVSDWGAVNDVVLSFKNGLNLEMPNTSNSNYDKLLRAYKNKELSEEEINEAVKPVFELIQRFQDTSAVDIDLAKIHQNAIKYAKESLVLLKNDDNFLPLSNKESILFIGDYVLNTYYQGSGSSKVNPFRVDSFVTEVNKYTSHASFVKGFDLDDKSINKKLNEEAIALASSKEKVIFILGRKKDSCGEGWDNDGIELPQEELDLLNEVLKVNKNVGVILENSNVIDLSFRNEIKQLIVAYLGGEGINVALVDTLFGKNNPSGRLAETFFKNVGNNPGYIYRNLDRKDIVHKESIFFGYRYYLSHKEDIIYPFGYGISFSKVNYSNFSVDKDYLNNNESIKISFDLENNSNLETKEVIQIYLKKPNINVFNAEKELVYFDKVSLLSNEKKHYEVEISYEKLAIYDDLSSSWKVEKGEYELFVSKNSLQDLFFKKIFVEGEEIISRRNSLNEKYFLKELSSISDEEYHSINKNYEKVYSYSKEKFDINSSIIYAKENGSKSAKFIYNLLKNNKKFKKDKMIYSGLFESPLRQFNSFVPNLIKDEEISLLVDILNDVKWRRNLIKLVSRLAKNNKNSK